MNTHVNGHFTPMTIGELRQSILAVYVGNTLFSDAEQLEANHDAHACEDIYYMVAWLKGVRLEDAKRSRIRRVELASVLPQPSVCHCEITAQAELRDLLACPGLNRYQKEGIEQNMRLVCFDTRDRLRWLGFGYQLLLENQGKLPKPRGYDALKDN